jgi:hypothetical protein
MKYGFACLVLPLALAAQTASAAPIVYTITGAYAASFTLDDTPNFTGIASDPQFAFLDPTDPNVFYISNVTGSFGGYTGLAGITFYNDIEEGGLSILFENPGSGNYDIVNIYGTQLFTGPVDAPTLVAPPGPILTALDASDPTGQTYIGYVPEPASWLMLAAGFGLAGATMRHRRGTRLSVQYI